MRTVSRGSGICSVKKARKGPTSGMLEESVYAIDFFRLSKMSRPSSTPLYDGREVVVDENHVRRLLGNG